LSCCWWCLDVVSVVLLFSVAWYFAWCLDAEKWIPAHVAQRLLVMKVVFYLLMLLSRGIATGALLMVRSRVLHMYCA
jgi:hypothetical protein